MPRTPDVPARAELVTTYAEFKAWLEGFANGHYGLLVVIGRGGTSKSQLIRSVLEGKECNLFKGHVTPLALYMDLFACRNQPVILDDAEGLYGNKDGKLLMKALCDTDPVKRLQWNSTNKKLTDAGVPTKFMTTSKVCVIQNRWHGADADAEAILTRAHLIHFDPTALEVHTEAANWFWDQEIFDFVAERLQTIERADARMYVLSWERKKAGGDWRRVILSRCLGEEYRLVQQLERTVKTANKREERFIEDTGLSRATFYRYRTELAASGQLVPLNVPALTLTRSEPPKIDPADLDEREEDEEEDDSEVAKTRDLRLPNPADTLVLHPVRRSSQVSRNGKR
jgi:hypothetical protein